jgi:hypothetical protein
MTRLILRSYFTRQRVGTLYLVRVLGREYAHIRLNGKAKR